MHVCLGKIYVIFFLFFSFPAKAAEAYGQLKTVKATLESTRQEMMEYKEKASRILQVKFISFFLQLGSSPPRWSRSGLCSCFVSCSQKSIAAHGSKLNKVYS